MNDFSTETEGPRSIWMRGLLMILMALAYQLASTLLFFVAIIQFILALVSQTPNPRLSAFGCSLGRYQAQNANFVSFASEELPFPFAEWPSSD
ncbi:putative lipase [Rhodoferax ferrireducens T118]|uniref:Putative lipase n=1 Tax=Albidiferax ferrireducens (strain ATCC BAA-621 / DSM 15236 / T118) TaxID=338969 RepID=Q21T77_ALBFT|nr:DUF4389 domain-containing protein [Rhodoferax ferrireducens]ABD71026.1 putative lipase [Rhodoferax ferrireducens T118]WPC66109.1 DUF4389 domain-containing protein [Rhodoferax ferrireducens]